jgi:hypothetical protein
MGMSYQVEEIVVPALAHVVGSGITQYLIWPMGFIRLEHYALMTHQRQLSS